MAAKCLITILAAGLAALHLLSIRQAQINTVHAMAQVHAEIALQESHLERFRVEIEQRCSPVLTAHDQLQAELDDAPGTH